MQISKVTLYRSKASHVTGYKENDMEQGYWYNMYISFLLEVTYLRWIEGTVAAWSTDDIKDSELLLLW